LTTFSCHVINNSDGDDCPAAIVADRDVSATSAFAAVNASVVSRPVGTSRIRIHWYDRPW
jgi:hypothetical protein